MHLTKAIGINMTKLITLLFTISILLAHGDGEEGHQHDRSHSAFGFIEGVIILSLIHI